MNDEINKSCDSLADEQAINEVDTDHFIETNGKTKFRNLLGFWLLGLCNNYPYVIMLSAAFDLLHPDHPNDQNDGSCRNDSRNGTICNPVSTGAILLADILPSLFIKLIAPFIAIRTHARVLISITLCAMSFIIASSFNHWMTFLGVVCAALSSGLGEVTFLSYSSFFDKNVVSTWSSGTGGAGVAGALSYAILKSFFSTKHTLQIMLVMPALTAITFWVILSHPQSGNNCRDYFCGSEMQPILEKDIDMSVIEYVKPKSYTWRQKVNLIKPLLKYMIPLGLVYFAEYFINQGLMELIYFPNVRMFDPCREHEQQYRWYQVDYQVGVLISRSSVNLFQWNKLWILPILQLLNAVILLSHVCFTFIPSIWIVLALIFYEGLLGGCAYVNTFYKISSEVSETDKEFSMGIASLADSMGIAFAGIVSLPVHDALCKLPAYT